MKGLTEEIAVVTGAGSGIGRATAVRFAEEGVDVVAPGPTETNVQRGMAGGGDPSGLPFDTSAMIDVPMDRAAQPEEMAGAAAFRCSDDASFVTGHTLPVDGGQAAD